MKDRRGPGTRQLPTCPVAPMTTTRLILSLLQHWRGARPTWVTPRGWPTGGDADSQQGPILAAGRERNLASAQICSDVDRPLGRVDRRIFGGFIEHLGRCIYGGVFDEGIPALELAPHSLSVLEIGLA